MLCGNAAMVDYAKEKSTILKRHSILTLDD
jgi:hypothetical protein